MKFLAVVSCSLMLAASAAAAADRFDPGSRPFVLAQAQGRGQAQGQEQPPQRAAERPVPMPQREMPGMGEGNRARMSPDERRQLRRDIRDAGRDIYRPGNRHDGGERRRPEQR